MGILHRMIFWELVKVFLLSLTGLTGLFLIAGLIQQASQLGLSPAQVLEVIPLLIPTTLPFTIPATTLFASCVVYGRLSNDNEAVAIKAAGVDLLTILRPAILLGLLTATVTAGLYYSLIPRTQQMLQRQLLEDPEEVLYNLLKRERRLNAPTLKYAIYVRDVQGRRLIDVVVKQKSAVKMDEYGPRIEYDFVARAREARLVVDLEKRTLKIDSDKWDWAGPDATGDFKDNVPPEVPLPESFDPKSIKAKPISLEWEDLDGRLVELASDREKLVAKRAEARRNLDRETNPAARQTLQVHDDQLEAKVKDLDRQVRSVRYEYHIRPALAVGCLCFAVIGCPIGIWANRADYLSTFVTCFLPTVFVYYPLLLAGGGLARDGKAPMAAGVWAANVVVGVAAVVLTFRLIKR
jgi:lipopolysaccharide export system permease protein